MAYPAFYHNAVAAIIDGCLPRARIALANALRQYRKLGRRQEARELLRHAIWVGYPTKH